MVDKPEIVPVITQYVLMAGEPVGYRARGSDATFELGRAVLAARPQKPETAASHATLTERIIEGFLGSDDAEVVVGDLQEMLQRDRAIYPAAIATIRHAMRLIKLFARLWAKQWSGGFQ